MPCFGRQNREKSASFGHLNTSSFVTGRSSRKNYWKFTIRTAKIQHTPKGVPDLMIQHFEAAENPNDALNVSFVKAIKSLNISGLLVQCGIRKDTHTIAGESSGDKRSAFEIFQFLCLWYFKAATCIVSSAQNVKTLPAPKALTIGS